MASRASFWEETHAPDQGFLPSCERLLRRSEGLGGLLRAVRWSRALSGFQRRELVTNQLFWVRFEFVVKVQTRPT